MADSAIRAALEAAYADGSWGRYHGPHGERLTAMLADLHGDPNVLLCCSGTFGVELALRALQVRAGDEVILAAYDFSGNFRCIEAVGALPVLVDIDPHTWSMDAAQLEEAVGTRTRAIVVSHLHGGIAPMERICRLAAQHSIWVVEDACQAPGARVQGKTAGTWGDVAVLSFGGSKLLTAGRGGALLTRHEDVFQRATIFCERGNHAFPLSELQAAVLAPQLEILEQRNAQRRSNVRRLRRGCKNLAGLRAVAEPPDDCSPSYYKFAWLYEPGAYGGRSRDEFLAAAQAEGIALDSGFPGFTRRSERRCRKVGQLTGSKQAATSTVLLHHPVLLAPPEMVDVVADGIAKLDEAFRR